jgi:hypothetical protein
MRPPPPDTARILRSKSCTSSRMADQLSARMCDSGSLGAPASITACPKGKVLSIEIDCRGPSANIHVTLSAKAWGWQL